MIFFDIDGTLVDHEGAERAGALAMQKEHADVFPEPPEDSVKRWHAVAQKHFRRYLAGELSFQGQRWARLRELFSHHRQLSDAEAEGLFQAYLAHYERNWRLYPDVVPCLSDVEGHSLGIISNGDSLQQRQKLERLGIGGLFSPVVISGDTGVWKPDPGIFELACEEARRPPAECWYVGDNLPNDAEAAARAGMLGIWINRKGSPAETGVPVISSLRELRDVVQLRDR